MPSTRFRFACIFSLAGRLLATPSHPAVYPLSDRDDTNITGTSNVWLDQQTGETHFMGSGVLLGLPLNGSQIPDHFLSDFGFWNMRSGGSQLPEPARGWTHGYEEFLGRYASLKSDYEVTRRHGGRFQIMIHDMWGTDSWPSLDATPMPGDNGSYADYDRFLDAFFLLLVEDDIIENVWWDLWNEPDNGLWSDRGLDRYLEYWGHAHHKIVRDFPQGKTTGPSYGRLPNFAGDMINWFTEWASYIKANNSVPDMVSMHFLYPNGDLNISTTQMQQILQNASVDYRGPWNIQEYGNPYQQIPSGAGWNLAQLERHNAPGLRANWRSGLELHDYLADLLGKADHYPNYQVNDTNYWPAQEYPVYQYYYQQMKGQRVRTDMTDDTLGDTFAVVNATERRVRILAGCRPYTGTWSIRLNSLSALGLRKSGVLSIQTTQFNPSTGLYDPAPVPEDLGYQNYTYTQDQLLFNIEQTDPAVAFAFEFSY